MFHRPPRVSVINLSRFFCRQHSTLQQGAFAVEKPPFTTQNQMRCFVVKSCFSDIFRHSFPYMCMESIKRGVEWVIPIFFGGVLNNYCTIYSKKIARGQTNSGGREGPPPPVDVCLEFLPYYGTACAAAVERVI
jgi:hypothetical protein